MIIDRQPIVRLGIRRLLEPDFAVEEAPDGREAVDLITAVGRFDVAVVEMRGRGANGEPSGAATIRELLRAQPALGVVARGRRNGADSVRQALDAGASAYVSGRSAPNALLLAVEAASESEAYIDPAADRSRPPITRRQRQVLQLYADGLSTAQAAEQLELSEQTVRTHAKASLSRLGARDRAHAVAIALRDSLID
jgi:DNA-binding NarL/FixJ family response regulator